MSGQEVVTLKDQYSIAGCPLNSPCATGQWTSGAEKVTAGGVAGRDLQRPIDLRSHRQPDGAGVGADARARDLTGADAVPTLDYPYHFDGSGRSAATDEADHIRDLIEQVLFTSPGERVMRPDFGAGLLALVFEPNSTDARGHDAVPGAERRCSGTCPA